jgi:glycosyltransferase involved in cell wall biosynthesis
MKSGTGRQAANDVGAAMPVTVVIPTRNSARSLRACLESVRAQSHDEVEVLVVDNESIDETPQIARGLSDMVLTAGPERSAQRNRGAAAATGRALLFVDSDMILAPDVIADCLRAVTRGAAAAVVIPEASFGEGFWARCKSLERSCYVEDTTIEAARFFTREVFEQLGGYDEQLVGGEDWDLHERARLAGARIGRADAYIWHDEGRLELAEVVAKKYHYGKTLGRYARKHPALARSQLHPFRPAFVRHRNRLVRYPLVTVGIVVMKLVEGLAGLAGLVAGTTERRPG